MGSTISSVRRLFSKKLIRILMIGFDGAGKTSILYRLKLGTFVKTFPTVGENVETIEQDNTIFTIRDVPCLRKVRNYHKVYLEVTDAVIFVIDSNDRFLMKEFHDKVRDMMDNYFHDSVFLIFANKQDILNCMSISEITEILELDELRSKRWYIQGTSAIQGNGLCEGLYWLSKEIFK